MFAISSTATATTILDFDWQTEQFVVDPKFWTKKTPFLR